MKRNTATGILTSPTCWQNLSKLLLSAATSSSWLALPKAFGWREMRSGLCLRPNTPELIAGFALGTPGSGSTWEMQVSCWITRPSCFQIASESTSDEAWHCFGLPEVLRIHMKKDSPFFSTSPLQLHLMTTYNSGSWITVDSLWRAFNLATLQGFITTYYLIMLLLAYNDIIFALYSSFVMNQDLAALDTIQPHRMMKGSTHPPELRA